MVVQSWCSDALPLQQPCHYSSLNQHQNNNHDQVQHGHGLHGSFSGSYEIKPHGYYSGSNHMSIGNMTSMTLIMGIVHRHQPTT